MALYKPIQVDGDEDIKTLMKKLYRFNEDIRYTMSNLDMEDNAPGVLAEIGKRGNMVRNISFDTDQLHIQYDDLKTNTTTSLHQSEDAINLLVSRGSVVDTLITRLDIYNESITLKSGQIVISADNMDLNSAGDATFKGKITGGSININGRFVVNEAGDCFIDNELITETLNPAEGIFAASLEVYNDNDYINNITGTVAAWGAYIGTDLTCRRLIQHSDKRLKRNIRAMDASLCAEAVRHIEPKTFRFSGSGRPAIGFIAQDIYRAQDEISPELPLVGRRGKYLEVPYQNYAALLAGTIQDNQKRINKLKRRISKWRTSTVR